MSARDQRNLLLEYRSGNSSNDVVDVILDNIPGRRYTFGTSKPRVAEGEEFIVYEGGIISISPSHCTIRVDDQGQFWIQDYNYNDQTTANANGNSTFSFDETFVNSRRVEGSEPRLLKSGDIISLGAPETEWAGPGFAPHPIYRVKFIQEEGILAGPQIGGNENEEGPKAGPEKSPIENGLILFKIMSYLSVPDLKNARLVSKMWKGEASILLEKKGQVSFDFGTPQDSKDVARYLLETEELKIQNLHIRLPSSASGQNRLFFTRGHPGDKMMSDLKKLLRSSHNFSRLSITCPDIRESIFPFLFLTLQELAGKLVELELEPDFLCLPKYLPKLPVMSNLRILTHNSWLDEEFTEDWVSFFVPLFTESLEFFHSECVGLGEAYLQEFLKHEMPKLRGIEIEEMITEESLSYLLQLKTPLTLLKLRYCSRSDKDFSLLENLLSKNSQSLQNLTLYICNEHKDQRITDVKFPSFPKLEELDLNYKAPPGWMRVSWESGDLDYKKHLPSLRKLRIVKSVRESTRDYGDEDDPVFDSFFPEDGAVTVKGVRVLVLELKAEQKMDRIQETFPNAVLSFVPVEDWNGYEDDDEHESSEDEHENSEDEHENSEDEHENSEDEHESSEDEHENSEDEHENSEDEHENSEDEHENSEDEHESSEDEHENSEDEHESSDEESDASRQSG